MADVLPLLPESRLRIAVLGDFDSIHTRSWLRWFVDRGHDVHAVSFYPPNEPLEGVTVHTLAARHERSSTRSTDPRSSRGSALLDRVPRGLVRIAQALRYQRAGLRRTLQAIAPDVVHAHFLVEHGFYGAAANVHPYVVTAWGSDVLVEPERDPVSKRIARWTIGRADLLTSNNRYMAERMIALGARRNRVEIITLGADRYVLDAHDRSVNVRLRDSGRAPAILSTRAHELLYNIDEIVDAYEIVRASAPGARLVVAHEGSQTVKLRQRAAERTGSIEFLGHVGRQQFRDALIGAEVFVSVPSSDGTSVALLQAMAAGCFPIVSDLPTQRELIDDGVNGLRVPLHRPDLLASAILRALGDPQLRRAAAAENQQRIEERGLNENEMLRMESLYLRLRPEARHA